MKLDWRKSRDFQKLSGPGLFNLRLFWWSYLILFLPQILFDVVAFESSTLLWLPIWTGAHLVAAFVALVFKGFGLDKRLEAKPSIILNFSVAAFLGSIRVVLIGFISFGLGMAPSFDIVQRILAGATLGVLLFAFLSSILVSNRDYQKTLKRLLATQNQLKNLRRSKRKEISNVQKELEAETRSVIEPQLDEIAARLSQEAIKPTDRRSIAADLKNLLENQVRPLSQRLRSTSKAYTDPKTFKRVSRTGLFQLPERVDAALALNPTLSCISFAAVFPFALYIFEGQEWILSGLGLVFIDTLVFLLAKVIFRRQPLLTPKVAVFSLALIVVMQVIANYIFLSLQGFPTKSNIYVAVLGILVIGISTTGFGLVAAYEYNQDNFLRKLSSNNKRLERELALLNQRLWVEKREWALRIHGAVQASLTAAVARLSGFGPIGKEDLGMIRSHIKQARIGLSESKLKPVDLITSIKNIKKTWSGIVRIDIDQKSTPAKTLISDKWASVCANEIIKEAVSNSVKHGRADRIKIDFAKADKGFMEITITDNGKGLTSKSKPGLGSQILDEIAYPWTIENLPESGTQLRARIPVSKSKG